MSRNSWRIAAVLVAALSIAAPLRAQETTPAMVAAAEKEGKVVWYTSVDVKVAEAIAKAFRAEYPKIQIEVERSGSERVFQRIGQEMQAGIRNVDVGQEVLITAPAELDIAPGAQVGVRFPSQRCRGLTR